MIAVPSLSKTKPSNSTSSIKFGEYALGLLFLLFVGLFGYTTQQNEFLQILGYGLPLFLIYGWVLRRADQAPLKFWIAVAILARLLLVFAFPNLSNDVYRFIWDGRLLNNGINPFAHLPTYYIENEITIEGIHPALYEELNSPNYYTIYPPVAQFIFYLATWLFPESIVGSAIVMKIFLFSFEVGSIFLLLRLLQQFQLPISNSLIYALNPLIIIELVGNLHFEAAMVFFLLLALYFLMLSKWSLSAIAMSLSIASKLLPLLFLPALLKRLGWNRSIRYYLLVGIATVLLFLPLFGTFFFSTFGDSLNLYFQKFEFNASLYYIVRQVGFWTHGYNRIADIGPQLALLAGSSIVLLALLNRKPNLSLLPRLWLFSICIYLTCTTTVHPWYVSLPLVLCGFTNFRFPVLWSALIMLTYINYSYTTYKEYYVVVILEYSLVWAYFIFEVWKKGSSSKTALMIPSS